MYKVVGIDEAGKGPVIGSMFIGFAIINLPNGEEELDSFQEHLKEKYGVKDSKKLTPKKRGEIYGRLREDLDVLYAQLTPAVIDGNYFSGGKLNDLEIRAIAQVLNESKPDLIIVDALTANLKKFAEQVRAKLNFECKIIAENKADDKYPLVGAASIVAKQLREQELEEIRQNIKLECGSGYPSDPKTKKFLKENFMNKDFDFIFRKSWQTYKDLLNNKVERTMDEFLDKEKNEK